MANTAPATALPELSEAPDVIEQKAQALADLIRTSKHFIAFTGAGVSTSAGIPDFRGPEGAWTLRAQGRQRTGKTTSTLQAIPTPTHMALAELVNRGIIKLLVSQNCDGLHRKSGLHPDKISELHGNSNREYCKDCGKDYIRDAKPRPPWATCPRSCASTPRTDDLMVRVMDRLDIPVPPFILHRRWVVEFSTTGEGRHQLTVRGVDVDGTPVTFLRTARLEQNRRVAQSEPFRFDFRGGVDPGMEFALELEFMGHYGEPNLPVVYSAPDSPQASNLYLMAYDPVTGIWQVSQQDSTAADGGPGNGAEAVGV